jgi:hypothetical protein
VEERSFKPLGKKMTVSGPSAKWRYVCTDGDKPEDNWPVLDYVDDDENTTFFIVREPKKCPLNPLSRLIS